MTEPLEHPDGDRLAYERRQSLAAPTRDERLTAWFMFQKMCATIEAELEGCALINVVGDER